MQTHRIDGIIIADPVMTTLADAGDVVPIVDMRTEKGQDYVYGGPTAFGGSFATAAFVQAHPDIVQAYVNAIVRTLKWMQKAGADQIFAMVPPDYYGRDPDIYKRSLAAALHTYVPDGRVTMDEVKNTYRQLLAAGRLKPDDKVDLAATFDNRFADAANKKY
jgi:NitT/TauT family transport system substrate-binding protein